MQKIAHFLLCLLFLISLTNSLSAQDQTQTESTEETDKTAVPEQVDVKPAAEDSEIQKRLSGILSATGWFTDTRVDVNDGVVFLRGSTETADYKEWAGELAQNTQDVAAVVQLAKEESQEISEPKRTKSTADQPEDSKIATDAEGKLRSNDEEIREQARKSRSPEEGEDLLQ